MGSFILQKGQSWVITLFATHHLNTSTKRTPRDNTIISDPQHLLCFGKIVSWNPAMTMIRPGLTPRAWTTVLPRRPTAL